jgi:hypothetical protein
VTVTRSGETESKEFIVIAGIDDDGQRGQSMLGPGRAGMGGPHLRRGRTLKSEKSANLSGGVAVVAMRLRAQPLLHAAVSGSPVASHAQGMDATKLLDAASLR